MSAGMYRPRTLATVCKYEHFGSRLVFTLFWAFDLAKSA